MIKDDLCDDLGLGPECCLDLAGGVASLQRGEADGGWGKRCCDNIRSPVTVPRGNISDQIMMEVPNIMSTRRIITLFSV